jgi:hypothetical protein
MSREALEVIRRSARWFEAASGGGIRWSLGEARPLGAVKPERDGRRISAIEVSFAGDSGADILRIENPMSLRVRQTAAGADRALEIVDDEGFCTRLGFRAIAKLEMLDGVAPGEL